MKIKRKMKIFRIFQVKISIDKKNVLKNVFYLNA